MSKKAGLSQATAVLCQQNTRNAFVAKMNLAPTLEVLFVFYVATARYYVAVREMLIKEGQLKSIRKLNQSVK